MAMKAPLFNRDECYSIRGLMGVRPPEDLTYPFVGLIPFDLFAYTREDAEKLHEHISNTYPCFILKLEKMTDRQFETVNEF